MFLDGSYFQGELHLPGLKARGGAAAVGVEKITQSVGENSLEWFIEKYEREFLDKLLGRTLATDFIEAMEGDEPEEKWTGLYKQIYREGDFPLSPAANYVYYWIQRSSMSKTTTKGEVKPKTDRASMTVPTHKLIKVWNDMRVDVECIWKHIIDNKQSFDIYLDVRFECLDNFQPINPFNL